MKKKFDHHQYVPVLRWKSSERQAVCKLEPTQRKCVTPIFELVPKDFATASTTSVLSKQAKQIAETWGWDELFFIDFHLLDENMTAHCVPIFMKQADAYNLKAGLVTGPNRSDSFQGAIKAALKNTGRELCFRISAYDLRQAGFQQTLKNLLNFYAKKPVDVHLTIDFESIGNPLPEIAAFTNTIPNLNDWRSLTVISGAFPKDLSHLEKNGQYELPRNDWLIWKNYAMTAKTRIPSFGDYTIQYGVFEEHEGKFFNFSASLRYTSDEYWVVMRGEGVQNEDGAGFKQFPAQAQLLAERSEFRGAQFSFGDQYIYSMGLQFEKSGHAKDWLAATFNHHITFVLWQLDNLFAGANNGALSSESSPGLHVGQA
jgi:Beta protein